MHPVLRTTLAVIVGMLIALMSMYLADRVNAYYFPAQQMSRSHAQIALDIQSLPLQAFWLIIGGFFLCGFFGAYTSARIAPLQLKAVAAGSIGFFLILIGNVFFLPFGFTVWVTITSFFVFILSAYLAYLGATFGLDSPPKNL